MTVETLPRVPAIPQPGQVVKVPEGCPVVVGRALTALPSSGGGERRAGVVMPG